MVSYKELKTGKKYKLGDIIVGEFVRADREPDGDIVLIFTGSQYGETGENNIYPDDEDEFEEIIPPNTAGGSKKNKRSKNKNKNKTKKTRTKNQPKLKKTRKTQKQK
jgi:hypothetical protein